MKYLILLLLFTGCLATKKGHSPKEPSDFSETRSYRWKSYLNLSNNNHIVKKKSLTFTPRKGIV